MWKLRVFLAAGLLICTSLRAGGTPQTPLILSLPLAQLSLWDAKSTEEYVEQLQGNKEGNKKGNKKQTPWSQEQINHARLLFSRLQRNNITIKKTLPVLLCKADPAKRSTLCRKCLHYFLHARPGEISATGGLTGMFNLQQHINDFVKRPLCSIRRVARSSPLSAITSMFNRKGFPTSSQKVSDYLDWELWWHKEGDNKVLDRELLRAISSMFNGKGLPSARVVETFLALDIWRQQKGDKKILDRELLRAFSSMFSGKGLPSVQTVETYLDLDVWWQQEGDKKILDRELLRVFSSMFCSKGLPKAQEVKDYLDLGVWWQQEGDRRILDRELLRAFSSMFSGKGLPSARAVETYLELDVWWQQEGDKKILDRELLRVFSSMFHGKGLPKGRDVQGYLELEVWWQQEGDKKILDRELLRAFSSMLCGKGLPKAQEVKDYLDLGVWWQQEGDRRILDRELLRVFSSMFHGKGLPKARDVQGYLELEVWWQQEGDKKILDRELLRAFSSMLCGKGLPKVDEVRTYLGLDVWWQQERGKKILDRELLRAFSSMFHCRGLPDISRSQALLDWLSVNGQPDRRTVHLMGSLYSGAFHGHGALGLPDLGRLIEYEQNLCVRLQLPCAETERGETERCDAEDGASSPVGVKQVALFLANIGGTRQLHWSDCVAFLECLPSRWPRAPLETLYAVLRLHGGGPGVQAWLSVLKAGVPEAAQIFLLRAMVQGVPLATARYAVDHIDRRDWQDYITVTRHFKRCPDRAEWTRIKGYLCAWHDILPRRDLQIRYLTLVQRFPENKRVSLLAAESLQAVLKSLPTLRVMTRLAKTCSDKELVNVFQACIDYDQAMNSGNVPPFRTQSTLFYALLKIQAPFYLRPPRPLSGQALSNIEDDPDSGVIISIHPESGSQDSKTLIWQFLVAVMDELSDIEYKTDRHRISLYPHGSDHEQAFLTPQLAEGSNGFHIRNWSREDLLRFFRATEWDELLYKSPNSDEREISLPSTRGDGKNISMAQGGRNSRPVYEQRREQHRQRQNIARQKAPGEPGLMEPASEAVLSLGMLQGLLKNRVHLNRHGWQAADFHKTRLSLNMLDLLRDRIAKASGDEVPDTLREYLASRYSEPESENTEDEAEYLLELLTQDATVFEPQPQPQLSPHSVEDLITAACRQDALNIAELEELGRFREQLTLEQTVQIIQRIPAFTSEAVVSQWTDLQQEKMTRAMVKDPLLLSSDEDIWNTLFNDSDGWLEAL